jgi:hypothetical protein
MGHAPSLALHPTTLNALLDYLLQSTHLTTQRGMVRCGVCGSSNRGKVEQQSTRTLYWVSDLLLFVSLSPEFSSSSVSFASCVHCSVMVNGIALKLIVFVPPMIRAAGACLHWREAGVYIDSCANSQLLGSRWTKLWVLLVLWPDSSLGDVNYQVLEDEPHAGELMIVVDSGIRYIFDMPSCCSYFAIICVCLKVLLYSFVVLARVLGGVNIFTLSDEPFISGTSLWGCAKVRRRISSCGAYFSMMSKWSRVSCARSDWSLLCSSHRSLKVLVLSGKSTGNRHRVFFFIVNN